MDKIYKFKIAVITLIIFTGCTSLEEKVDEYAAIQQEIDQIYDEISTGKKDQEIGITEIAELQKDLESFDTEVTKQYYKEEEIKREIEKKNRKLAIKSRRDSLEQARIKKREANELRIANTKKAREEAARLKAEELERREEVAEMVAAEERADRNAYINELNENGLFLVEFDGETYEINKKGWIQWKESENYNSAETAAKYREMFTAMGTAKANTLAGSLYRTVSKGIAREGISYKAIQGIQVYDVLTTGELKFD